MFEDVGVCLWVLRERGREGVCNVCTLCRETEKLKAIIRLLDKNKGRARPKVRRPPENKKCAKQKKYKKRRREGNSKKRSSSRRRKKRGRGKGRRSIMSIMGGRGGRRGGNAQDTRSNCITHTEKTKVTTNESIITIIF